MCTSRSIFLIVGLLVTAISVQAQRVVLYQREDRLLTQAEVDSSVAQISRRIKAQGLVAYAEVTGKVHRQDTVLYTYSIVRASPEMKVEHVKRQRLLDKPLPDFALRDLNGKPMTSKSLLGKPVVLNMWFIACASCIAEMPALNNAMTDPANKDITFLAVTFEKKDKVAAFLQKHTFAFQHVPDAQQYCDIFTQAFPLTIFVDRQGIVRSIQGPLPFVGPGVTSGKFVLSADGESRLDATAFYDALAEIR